MEQIDPLLIVWDLDETLIHCDDLEMVDRTDPDFTWDEEEYRFFIRPGAKEIIALLDSDDAFRQGVFTASSADYAELVVSHLWPDNSQPEFILSSSSMTKSAVSGGHYTGEYLPLKNIKKVSKLGYNKGRIVAIDDKPDLYRMSYGNVVAINPFLAEPDDNVIADLKKYLSILKNIPDVRKIEKRGWRQRMQRCDISLLSVEP